MTPEKPLPHRQVREGGYGSPEVEDEVPATTKAAGDDAEPAAEDTADGGPSTSQ